MGSGQDLFQDVPIVQIALKCGPPLQAWIRQAVYAEGSFLVSIDKVVLDRNGLSRVELTDPSDRVECAIRSLGSIKSNRVVVDSGSIVGEPDPSP